MTRKPPMTARIRRPASWLAALAIPAAVALSGCSAPLPGVSFYGDRVNVVTAPSLWCAPDADVTTVTCAVDRGDTGAPHLRLDRGAAVSVNVPAGVAAAPWVVLFQYRDVKGATQEGRGPLFSADARQAYVLRPPAATDQLTRIEVQSGLTPVTSDAGTGVDYAATRTWVLLIDPK